MSSYKHDDNINTSEGGIEDFPKEIVQLLMKNHPIKNPDMLSREKYSATHNDREEIRVARKRRIEEASVETDAQEFKVKAESNLEISDEIIHKQEAKKEEPREVEEIKSIFDEDEEMVQLVRRTSRLDKQRNKRTSTNYDTEYNEGNSRELRFSAKKVLGKQTKEKFDDEEDVYYDIKTKEDTNRVLDNFFSDDEYEDNERHISGKTVFLTGATLVAVLILFLGYKTISLTGKLNEANKKLAVFDELQAKNEELKLTVLSLEEKESKESELPVDEVSGEQNNTDSENKDNDQETSSTVTAKPIVSESFDTYTVVNGDSFWTIAQKTLGNGALYQKILDANGLKENDSIKEGQTLKIPKQ